MNRVHFIFFFITQFFITNCLGMVESVAIFTGDNDKEICVIGQDIQEGFLDETSTFQGHLERWSKSPNAPACLIPLDKRLTEHKVRLQASIIKQHDGSYNCDPQTLILYLACLNNPYGNIRFSFLPQKRMFEHQLSFFSNNMFDLIRAAGVRHKTFSSAATYDKALQNSTKRQAIFAAGGLFATLKSISVTLLTDQLKALGETCCTVEEYFTHFDTITTEFEAYTKNVGTSPQLQALFARHLKTALLARTKLKAFFNQYTTDLKSPLLEPQFAALASGSAMKTYHEIKAATMPSITIVNSLKTLIQLLTMLKENPRAFLFCGQNIALELHRDLADLGFKGECYGNLQSLAGAILQNKRRFERKDFDKVLSTVFNESSLERSKKSENHLVIKILPPEYLDIEKNVSSTTPFNEVDSYTCKSCSQTLAASYLYAVTSDKKAYCSFPCFIKSLQEQISDNNIMAKRTQLYTLLNGSQELTKEEKIILIRCATLLHYYMLPLMDGRLDDRSKLYNCYHQKLLQLLEKSYAIPDDCKETDLVFWRTASELASCFGCDIKRLSKVLQCTQKIKKDYIAQLITKAHSLHYKKMTDEEAPLFDPHNMLTRLQNQHIIALAKRLNFSDLSKRVTFFTLYTNLIDLIKQRLGVSKIDYESVFAERVLSLEPQDTQKPLQKTSGRLVEESNSSDLEEQLCEEESETAIPTAESAQIIKPFVAAKKRPYSPIKQIQGFFASKIPYSITLFNARKHFAQTPETIAATEQFRKCTEFTEAYRIKTLFALLENGINIGTLDFTDAHSCLLRYAPKNVDASLLEKLDLHHLFTRSVDPYIFSCGITEKIDNLIQVSIPGELSIKGKSKIGFFQYSFQVDGWKCIHRCFKEYHQNIDETYISKPLRKALLAFLQEHMADNNDYADVINHLERLCID